jgi:hypothetical protein
MDVVERHVFEQRSTGLHEVLLGWIGNEVELLWAALGTLRHLFEMSYCIPVRLPGMEHDQKAIVVVALERLAEIALSRKAAQQLHIREKKEGIKGHVFGLQAGGYYFTPVKAHHRLGGIWPWFEGMDRYKA